MNNERERDVDDDLSGGDVEERERGEVGDSNSDVEDWDRHKDKDWATARIARTGDIVGAYKSLVANGCLEICKSKNEIMGKLWHRNYYEHIIRDDQSYQNISNYIYSESAKWNAGKFF